MSDPESRLEDARRDAYYDKLDALMPDDDCECGVHNWKLAESTIYGDDTDGNRGVPLKLWECRGCGRELQVTG